MWWVQSLVAWFTTSYMDAAGAWKRMAVWGCVCVCVCLCVCLRDRMKVHVVSFLYLLFFHAGFQQGTVLHYLGHRGVKKTAHFGSRDDTSLNRQRHTGHRLPSDLHLLLNDKLKTPKQRMQTRRPVLIPQQTHSLICLLTVLFIRLLFEPAE